MELMGPRPLRRTTDLSPNFPVSVITILRPFRLKTAQALEFLEPGRTEASPHWEGPRHPNGQKNQQVLRLLDCGGW